jgi:ComF family protein
MVFMPPTDRLIHHYKYLKKTKLVHLFGGAMASLIRADFVLRQADTIIPVPLFWWKRLRRGYNQAALLAQIISEETGIPVKDILKRVKNTKTQTRLTESERAKNVLNAFTIQANNIKGQNVLLIDDVLTTGATLNECARVLKQTGAAQVYSCVAAVTPDTKSSNG